MRLSRVRFRIASWPLEKGCCQVLASGMPAHPEPCRQVSASVPRFYSERYAATICTRKMPALNKTRISTNTTMELTVWPGPTLASDKRAVQASETSVKYVNGASGRRGAGPVHTKAGPPVELKSGGPCQLLAMALPQNGSAGGFFMTELPQA
jgi:hypothetical protein